jgi:hypothetical protein
MFAYGPGGIGKAVGYLRGLLLPWLAIFLVLLAFAVAGLRWVKDGAAAGFTRDQMWQVIGALTVMFVMRFLADANRISLHDFYRWRLASAFSVIRDTSREECSSNTTARSSTPTGSWERRRSSWPCRDKGEQP